MTDLNPPPVTAEGPPSVRWHRVEVTTTWPKGEPTRRIVEGDDAWVAASLRALADQLAPLRPPMPAHRTTAPVADIVRQGMTTRRGGNVIRQPGVDGPPVAYHPDPMSMQ